MPSLGDWRYQLLLARARKKIKSAKRRARPELTTRAMWQNNDYANTFSLSTDKVEDGLERISVHEVSTQQFIDRFEAPGLPVVVEGAQEGWRAGARWTLQRLGKKYRHQPFKVGTDAEGQSVRVKLKYYLEYLATNRDDSPLYIFDHDYGEDRRRGRLLEDYSLPEYCREDLMQYMGEERRPPYRWVVLGPARSGTGIHIDPLATSAWNALVRGTKRWCFFPPCTPGSVVGAGLGLEAAEWWAQVYPATRGGSWPQEYRPIECIQRAGETVFVPGGWWHVVVNLEPAVAVTHNYCSSTNFPQVWAKVVRGRPGLASVWRTNLASCRPDLAALADKDLPCSGEESILVWSSTDGGTGGWVPSPGPEQVAPPPPLLPYTSSTTSFPLLPNTSTTSLPLGRLCLPRVHDHHHGRRHLHLHPGGPRRGGGQGGGDGGGRGGEGHRGADGGLLLLLREGGGEGGGGEGGPERDAGGGVPGGGARGGAGHQLQGQGGQAGGGGAGGEGAGGASEGEWKRGEVSVLLRVVAKY